MMWMNVKQNKNDCKPSKQVHAMLTNTKTDDYNRDLQTVQLLLFKELWLQCEFLSVEIIGHLEWFGCDAFSDPLGE